MAAPDKNLEQPREWKYEDAPLKARDQFAGAIKDRIKLLDLSILEIAEALDIRPQAVHKYLNGKSIPKHPRMLVALLEKLGFNPHAAMKEWGFCGELLDNVYRVQYFRGQIRIGEDTVQYVQNLLTKGKEALREGEVKSAHDTTKRVLKIAEELKKDPTYKEDVYNQLRYRAFDLYLDILTRTDIWDVDAFTYGAEMLSIGKAQRLSDGDPNAEAQAYIRLADLYAKESNARQCFNMALLAVNSASSIFVKAEALRCILHALRALSDIKKLKKYIEIAEGLLAIMRSGYSTPRSHEYLCLSQAVGWSKVQINPVIGIQYLLDTVQEYEKNWRGIHMQEHMLEALLFQRAATALVLHGAPHTHKQALNLLQHSMVLSDGLYIPIYYEAKRTRNKLAG